MHFKSHELLLRLVYPRTGYLGSFVLEFPAGHPLAHRQFSQARPSARQLLWDRHPIYQFARPAGIPEQVSSHSCTVQPVATVGKSAGGFCPWVSMHILQASAAFLSGYSHCTGLLESIHHYLSPRTHRQDFTLGSNNFQVAFLLISSAFAFLSAKMEVDHMDTMIDWLGGDYYPSWEYNISMKIVVNSLSPFFFIFFTFKICTTLTSAAAFLRQSQSTIEHAIKYERIITFSKAMCALFIFFPLLLENVLSGLLISDNLRRFYIGLNIDDYALSWETQMHVRHCIEIILCLKSGSYATVYLWLKHKQN